MYTTTECIILNIIPYSDSKNIVHCYSDKKGKISFLQYRGKGKRKKNEPYFYPFALLEIQYRDNDKKSIHTIHSCQYAEINQSVLNNPLKRSFALFLAEFTNAVIMEEEGNVHLFGYIKTFIQWLDEVREGYQYFHLKYMLELSRFAGFFPDLDDPFQSELSGTFSAKQVNQLKTLVGTSYAELSEIKIPKTEVTALLDAIIRYYNLHFSDFRTPDSLRVFREF